MARPLEQWKQDIIRKNYADGDLQVIADQCGSTVRNVRAWAALHGIGRKPLWSSEHIALLRSEYPAGDIGKIVSATGKNAHAIINYASKLGIVRTIEGNRKGDLRPLLSGTMQAYYWLGFYAADGYISKGGHFQCGQRLKDKDRIDSLASFLKTSVYVVENAGVGGYKPATYFKVAIQDKDVGVQIRNLMGTIGKKTYEGVNLDFMTPLDERNLAFLVGFIDGDGCVAKSGKAVCCMCHLSWMDTFHRLSRLVSEPVSSSFTIREVFQKRTGKWFSSFNLKVDGTKYLSTWLSKSAIDYSARKWSHAIAAAKV